MGKTENFLDSVNKTVLLWREISMQFAKISFEMTKKGHSWEEIKIELEKLINKNE